MVGAQLVAAVVEVGQLARGHVDRVDGQAHAAGRVQVVKIDQFLERVAQWRGVVVRRFLGQHLHAEREAAEQAWRKEAAHAAHDGVDRVEPDVGAALRIAQAHPQMGVGIQRGDAVGIVGRAHRGPAGSRIRHS